MTQTSVLEARARIDALRAAIARRYRLFEVRRHTAGADWQRIDDVSEPFDWDAPLPLSGAKRFFFPQRDALVRWEGGRVEETLPAPPPFALFGLRSCDLEAIGYQDQFFATDPYYVRRRERALLVGVNCTRACAGGFCREVDAGPFARQGFDLNLTSLPDGRVVVEIGTRLGHAVCADADLTVTELDAATRAGFDQARADAIASFPARPFVRRAIARINAADTGINGVDWTAFGPSCFACSGCSNVCPTCSCFTVVDEARDNAGERVRYWDSCLLEGFQREASGYHPAPRPADRVRRFWYHKFSDDFTAELGRVGCVGCGRCDTACLGAIGAERVLGALGAQG
jgi:formate hydrogenlyase subunit 6/NADH:ubiquinone oxidoreductase subunit I